MTNQMNKNIINSATNYTLSTNTKSYHALGLIINFKIFYNCLQLYTTLASTFINKPSAMSNVPTF